MSKYLGSGGGYPPKKQKSKKLHLPGRVSIEESMAATIFSMLHYQPLMLILPLMMTLTVNNTINNKEYCCMIEYPYFLVAKMTSMICYRTETYVKLFKRTNHRRKKNARKKKINRIYHSTHNSVAYITWQWMSRELGWCDDATHRLPLKERGADADADILTLLKSLLLLRMLLFS